MTLYHTNEVLCPLGADLYQWRTATHANEVVSRKRQHVASQLDATLAKLSVYPTPSASNSTLAVPADQSPQLGLQFVDTGEAEPSGVITEWEDESAAPAPPAADAVATRPNSGASPPGWAPDKILAVLNKHATRGGAGDEWMSPVPASSSARSTAAAASTPSSKSSQAAKLDAIPVAPSQAPNASVSSSSAMSPVSTSAALVRGPTAAAIAVAPVSAGHSALAVAGDVVERPGMVAAQPAPVPAQGAADRPRSKFAQRLRGQAES